MVLANRLDFNQADHMRGSDHMHGSHHLHGCYRMYGGFCESHRNIAESLSATNLFRLLTLFSADRFSIIFFVRHGKNGMIIPINMKWIKVLNASK